MARTYNILIVDDEQSVVFLLKEELSEIEKYNITVAYDGAEAINILQTQPFDVVLLDVKMPRVSGIEVLKVHPRTASDDNRPHVDKFCRRQDGDRDHETRCVRLRQQTV